MQVAGIAMQGKFFQYHYSATLPLIAFIAGLGLYKLWRRCLPGGAGGVVAFASFLVVAAVMRTAVHDLPGSFWWRSMVRIEYLLGKTFYSSRELLDRELYYVADFNLDADRRVANRDRAEHAAEGHIFVWGFEPAIYWIAHRRPASRFIYDVPQRVTWQRDYARRELMADLQRHPPDVIVVQHNDVFAWVTGDNKDSARALDAFPALPKLVDEHYKPTNGSRTSRSTNGRTTARHMAPPGRNHDMLRGAARRLCRAAPGAACSGVEGFCYGITAAASG